MIEAIDSHPFERTLGQGPYKYVGFFYINIEAGKQGRPYINPNDVHPRFVRGAGTCAHCGQAILNVCQIQIGNGDVFGVGLDCVGKVDMPVKELTLIQKDKAKRDKELRLARKAAKGASAREELRAYMQANESLLKSKPHPTAIMTNNGHTLYSYAEYCLNKSNDSGIVFVLANVKRLSGI